MTEPRAHPAPWNLHVLGYVEEVLGQEQMRLGKSNIRVLDPFGGIGRIHEIPFNTVSVELEPEWANMGAALGESWIGDATDMHWFRRNSMGAIASSVNFGNRMSDHHNAQERCRNCWPAGKLSRLKKKCVKCNSTGYRKHHRRTYKHYLGRDLSPNSASAMYWGKTYRKFHVRFLLEAMRVTKPGGLVIINVANHLKTMKKGEPPVEQRVSEWWIFTMIKMGFGIEEIRRIHTSKYGYGANRDTRTVGELVVVARMAA